MSNETTRLPLLLTRFNRPHVHQDFVPRPRALECLNRQHQRALTLAQPGGFIRLFVDLGAGLSNLLMRLKGQDVPLVGVMSGVTWGAP